MFKVILKAKNGRFAAFQFNEGRKAREFANEIERNAKYRYTLILLQAYDNELKKWVTIRNYKWEDSK